MACAFVIVLTQSRHPAGRHHIRKGAAGMTNRPSHLCSSGAIRPTQFDLQAGLQTAAQLVHHYGEEFLDIFLTVEAAFARQSSALERAAQICRAATHQKDPQN